MGRACRYIDISRQAYYKHQQSKTRQSTREAKVRVLVNHLRLHQSCLGTCRLQYVLRMPLTEASTQVDRGRLFGILRVVWLLVIPQRAYHKTTHSHHRFRRHPNLLKDGPNRITPTGPEQVWVADITYLPTAQHCAYLSLVTGTYSRKIVGYHVHDNPHTESVAQTLKIALKTCHTRQPLVHHSDRGVQYCSAEYQCIHQRHGITCSTTDSYDCYRNALAERVNDIFKRELLLRRPADLEQTARMMAWAVHTYNHERSHLTLKYKAPSAVRRALAG